MRTRIKFCGMVRATDIDPNYASRPEPEKTLADVQAL